MRGGPHPIATGSGGWTDDSEGGRVSDGCSCDGGGEGGCGVFIGIRVRVGEALGSEWAAAAREATASAESAASLAAVRGFFFPMR